MDQNEQLEEVIVKKKKLPLWLIPVISVIVVAIVAATVTLAKNAGASRKYDEYMELARKYALELNYEQAIIAYRAAIEIDPKRAEPYIELADVYCQAGEPEKAQEILKQALDNVDGDNKAKARKEIKKELQAVEEILGITDTANGSKDADDPDSSDLPGGGSNDDNGGSAGIGNDPDGLLGDTVAGDSPDNGSPDSGDPDSDPSTGAPSDDSSSDGNSSYDPFSDFSDDSEDTSVSYSYGSDGSSVAVTPADTASFVPWAQYVAAGGSDYEVQFNDPLLNELVPMIPSTGNTTLSRIYNIPTVVLQFPLLHDQELIDYDESTGRASATVDLTELNQFVNMQSLLVIVRNSVYLSRIGNVPLDIKLTNLGALTQLKSLRQIQIHGVSSDTGIITIGSVSGSFPSLTSFISNICSFSDHTFLNSMPSLESLVLTDSGLSDLSVLDKLDSLKVLNLSGNHISDISRLSSHRTIESLTLTGNPVSDYSPIYDLTGLKYIALSSTAKEEFTKLRTFRDLEGINISGKVDDISWLKDFPGLKTLTVETPSYDPVAGILRLLTDIAELSIHNCSINDLSEIGIHTTLKKLTLDGCKITDITPIGRLKKLEYLSLQNNDINDVRVIGNLVRLKDLYLINNSIEDISSFSTLKDLEYIYLDGNDIAAVKSLTGLDKLIYVSLSGSTVIDYRDIITLYDKTNQGLYYYSSANPEYCDVFFEYTGSRPRIEGYELDENNHIRIPSGTDLTFSVTTDEGWFWADRTDICTGESTDLSQTGDNEWTLQFEGSYGLVKITINYN